MVPLRLSVKITALLALVSGLGAQSRFVYANNDVPSTNTVSGFTANSNGVLTQITGSPFATGGGGVAGGASGVDRITVAGGKNLFSFQRGGEKNNQVFVFSSPPGVRVAAAAPPFSYGEARVFAIVSCRPAR